MRLSLIFISNCYLKCFLKKTKIIFLLYHRNAFPAPHGTAPDAAGDSRVDEAHLRQSSEPRICVEFRQHPRCLQQHLLHRPPGARGLFSARVTPLASQLSQGDNDNLVSSFFHFEEFPKQKLYTKNLIIWNLRLKPCSTFSAALDRFNLA